MKVCVAGEVIVRFCFAPSMGLDVAGLQKGAFLGRWEGHGAGFSHTRGGWLVGWIVWLGSRGNAKGIHRKALHGGDLGDTKDGGSRKRCATWVMMMIMIGAKGVGVGLMG